MASLFEAEPVVAFVMVYAILLCRSGDGLEADYSWGWR